MSATPQDAQAKIDSAVVNLKKVTGKYAPSGKYWKPAMDDLASARAEVGLLLPEIAPVPVPVPTPTPLPPTGAVLFDGRASRLTELVGREVSATDPAKTNGPIKWTDGTSHYFDLHDTPNIWVINFIKDNMVLLNSPRYGKEIRARAAVGDSNAWQMKAFLAQQKAASQISVHNTVKLGRVDYYAFASRIDAWNGDQSALQWCDLISVGYQTSANDQCALAFRAKSGGGLEYTIQSNAGYGMSTTTNPIGTTFYRDRLKDVKFGVQEEWIVGVKWATHKDGFMQVWNRVPEVDNVWRKLYDYQGIDTQFYGTSVNGTFAQDGDRINLDKLGIYYGRYPAGITQEVYESGLTRSADLATAQATLPA